MPTRHPHTTSPHAHRPKNRYVVCAASGVVQVVLTMGLLVLCARMATGTPETLLSRQMIFAASCVLFIVSVCGASAILPYDPIVDGEGAKLTRPSVRLTSTLILVASCYGSVLVLHDWMGKAAFGVSLIWAASMSATHVARLVAYALGGRSMFLGD